MEVAEALYERRAATFLSLGRHFPQEMQPEFSEVVCIYFHISNHLSFKASFCISEE